MDAPRVAHALRERGRLAIVFALVVAWLLPAVPGAAQMDYGEILEWDSDNVIDVPRTIRLQDGRTAVTAQVVGVRNRCPEFATDCSPQFRLSNRRVSGLFPRTWHEWGPTIVPASESDSPVVLTPRVGCGYHQWKVEYRFTYRMARTITVEHGWAGEVGFSIELGRVVAKNILKGLGGGSITLGAKIDHKESYSRTVHEYVETPWVTVDETRRCGVRTRQGHGRE